MTRTIYCVAVTTAALFLGGPVFAQERSTTESAEAEDAEAAADDAEEAPRGAISDIRFPPPLDDVTTKGFELTPWLTIKPYLRQSVYGTTNLFQQSKSGRSTSFVPFVGNTSTKGKQNDVLFATMPGLDIIAAGDDGRLAFGYVPTFLLAAKNGGEIDTVEHRMRLDSSLTLGKLTLTASGSTTWGISISDPQFVGRFHNFSGNGFTSAEYQLTETFGFLHEFTFNAFENFPRGLKATNVASWESDSFLTIQPNTEHDIKFLVGAGFREWHYIDESAVQPDITLGHVMAGIQYEIADLITVNGRIGIEDSSIKKKRGFRATAADPGLDDGLSGLDGLIARGSATWTAIPQWTTLSITGSHRAEATPEAPWRRTTAFGGNISQRLPFSLEAQFSANWQVRQPRRAQDLRVHTYTFNLAWFGVEHVEFAGQMGYTRASSRRNRYEVFHGGISLTFRL
ncbi:MAG: hypothetical protein JKY65_32050 [Planctomycetes bacterium]|nr:hypothetical protein [Planctomycetota bacterium]